MASKTRIRKGSTRFPLQMDQPLIDWLDLEAQARDRSRNWVIVEAVEAFRRRVERARQHKAERAKQALEGLRTKPEARKRG